MKTALGNKIHALLVRHRGEENAITSAEIAERLGLRPSAQRQIREVIAAESALWSDVIVVGFGGLGYFACEGVEEAIKYRDWLLGTFTEIGEKIADFEAHCRRHGIRVPPPLDEMAGPKMKKLLAWLERVPAKVGRAA